MIVSSAKPSSGQRVKDMVERARENAKPWECGQGVRKTCLYGFYHRRVSCCSEVAG